MRYLTLLLVVVAGLAWGCQKEPAPPANAKKQPVQAKPEAPPELPKLVKPEAPPAKRVVDIFYSANVAGDADPCG